MKFAATIEYVLDKQQIKAIRPMHRQYLRGFLENGHLLAAGHFDDDSGALWIVEAETMEDAQRIVSGDPSVSAGVFTSWSIRPFAYWSAKESKGA